MRAILSGILLLFITGCSALPTPREMGDMALMRTLGVDSQGETLTLTASTGRQARGLQREVEAPLVLEATGASMSGATAILDGLSHKSIFYGYVDQLLLGEGATSGGLEEILTYFARSVELGLGTQVWAVEGTALAAIQSGGDAGVESRLDTLQIDSQLGVTGMTRTVGQTLTDLLEEGATYLPLLTVTQGESPALLERGYLLLKEEGQVATLSGDSARGLELLAGHPSGDVFQGMDGTAVTIWQAETSVAPSERGAVIYCEVTADLVEYSQLPTEEEMEMLRLALIQREEGRIALALGVMQRAGCDALGLGRQLGMAQPWAWEEMSQTWVEDFGQMEFEIVVDVTIRRG